MGLDPEYSLAYAEAYTSEELAVKIRQTRKLIREVEWNGQRCDGPRETLERLLEVRRLRKRLGYL